MFHEGLFLHIKLRISKLTGLTLETLLGGCAVGIAFPLSFWLAFSAKLLYSGKHAATAKYSKKICLALEPASFFFFS